MRRVLAALIATVLLLLAMRSSTPVSAATGTASVVFVHAVPNAPAVDVYIDGARVLDGAAASTVSAAIQVSSRIHTVAITAGTDPDDSAPIRETQTTFVSGADMSLVAHLDAMGNLALSSFRNDTSPPLTGDGRLTIRHLAPGVGQTAGLQISGDVGTAVATLKNGTSFSTDLPSGDYAVSLVGTSRTARIPSSGSSAPGTNVGAHVIMYAVQDPSGETVDLLTQTVDAPGAPAMLNIIHGIPGTSIDVYLDGLRILAGLDAGDVAGPRLVTAGPHDVEIFAAGDPYVAGSGMLTGNNVPVAAEADLSIVAHLTAGSIPAPSLTIYIDNLTLTPDDRANLVVRHVADTLAVDVVTGTSVLLDSIEHRESPGAQVAAGTYPILAKLDIDDSLVATLGPLTLDAGTNTVVYMFGGVGGSTLDFTTQVTRGLATSGAFPDAGDAFYTDDVRTIYQLGITQGSSGAYEPDRPVSRAEMAAMLNRALGLRAGAVDAFDDDDASPFEADINAIAAAGITMGTSATTYAPDAAVTRAQVAGFLVRAFSIPASNSDFFVDDDGHGLEAEINALAAAGITKGTSSTTYAPELPVSRGEAASFLARSLGLG